MPEESETTSNMDLPQQEPDTAPLSATTAQTEVPIEIAEETPENFMPENLPPTETGGGKRKIFIAVGVAIIIFLAIFFFIFKTIFSLAGRGESVELTYWGLWEDEAVVRPIIEEYQQKNKKVKITYSKQEPRNYREKLLSRGREGRGPDIFRFHNTWLSSISEITSPLPGKIMTGEEYDRTFYPVAKNDLKKGDNYYGLPLEIDGLVMVYNQDMLRAAGIATAPKTWNEIVAASSSLLVQDEGGSIITSGVALGTAGNVEHFSDIFATLLLQNGGDIENIASSESVEALKFYRSFAEPPTPVWNETMPNNIAAFIQGKVAIIFVPTWQILSIKAASPDLNLKVAPMPVLPGSPLLSVASYWVEGVSRTSKHQQEAWEFLKFLTEKETMVKLYEAQIKQGRLFGEPYSRIDLQDKLLDNQYLSALMEQAKNLRSVPLISRTFDNGINDGSISYLTDAINATIEGVSYAQALQVAQTGVQQTRAKFVIE